MYKRSAQRREEADERQAQRDARTWYQQLARLNCRPGRSMREVARLHMQEIAEEKAQVAR